MINTPALVRREYSTSDGLRKRREAVDEFLVGPNAREVAYNTVLRKHPVHVLEIGCGYGDFAERLSLDGFKAIGLDLSLAMVRMASQRGVVTVGANVESLPFKDGSFDCVVALWMLYNIQNLNLALRELSRVLLPTGALVLTLPGRKNLAELWELAGEDYMANHPLTWERAIPLLKQHFPTVTANNIRAHLEFPTYSHMRDYLAAHMTQKHLASRIPQSGDAYRVRTDQAVVTALNG